MRLTLILAVTLLACGVHAQEKPLNPNPCPADAVCADPPECKSAMKRTSPTTWECPDPKYTVDTSLLAKKRRHIFTTDADRLEKLGYHGAHRAVYVIGTDKCFTDDDRKPFPQADLVCK